MIKSKLKVLLATHDSNQSKLAKEIQVRQPTISAIANNTIKQIPIDVLDKICDYFKCQPGDVIEHIPENVPAAITNPTEPKAISKPTAPAEPAAKVSEKHYRPFTEADARRIDLKELTSSIHYQLDISQTFGTDVLAVLLEAARQQDTEQANAAEDFQTIVMNALRDTLGLTDSQAAESSPAATPEE